MRDEGVALEESDAPVVVAPFEGRGGGSAATAAGVQK